MISHWPSERARAQISVYIIALVAGKILKALRARARLVSARTSHRVDSRIIIVRASSCLFVCLFVRVLWLHTFHTKQHRLAAKLICAGFATTQHNATMRSRWVRTSAKWKYDNDCARSRLLISSLRVVLRTIAHLAIVHPSLSFSRLICLVSRARESLCRAR